MRCQIARSESQDSNSAQCDLAPLRSLLYLCAVASVIYIVALALLWLFALITLVVALSAHRKSPRGQARRLEEIELAIADLDERQASLLKSHKKLNSRVAMRMAREAKSVQDEETTEQKPGESSQEWKARMRKLIARGKLGHSSDDEVEVL